MLVYVWFLFSFIFGTTYLRVRNSSTPGRHAYLYSWLFLSLIVWLSTETFSIFNLLKPPVIFAVWVTAFLALIAVFSIFLRRAEGKEFEKMLHHPLILFQIRDKDSLLIVVLSLVFIILPLFLLAVFFPPNNWDSMTYHLPRVEHWIQNGNLSSYPTSIYRQIFHQPFAEYFILHLRVLTSDDYLSNTVQFASMLGTIIAVSLIIRELGGSEKWQLLGCVICLTLPTGIAESITTQTDYLASFYCVTFLYFCIRYLLTNSPMSWQRSTLLGLSLGFGILTKAHIVLFVIPFCLWLGSFTLIGNCKKFLNTFIIGGTIVFIINAPFYYRNYETTGNIIGDTTIAAEITNQEKGIRPALSNTLKNLSLSLMLPVKIYNAHLFSLNEKIHNNVLQYNINNNNLGNSDYRLRWLMDEDRVGNFFLCAVWLILSCYVFMSLFRKNRLSLRFYGVYFASFFALLLYSGVFRWQVFGNRLLLPWFISVIPVVVLVMKNLDTSKRDYLKLFFIDKILVISLIVIALTISLLYTTWLAKVLLPLILITALAIFWLKKKRIIKLTFPIYISLALLLSATIFVFHAPRRPFNEIVTGRNDVTKITWGNGLSPENLVKLQEIVVNHDIHSLALAIGWDTWEYPIWRILRDDGVHIRHKVNVNFKSYNENAANYEALLTEFPEKFEMNDNVSQVILLPNNLDINTWSYNKNWALYIYRGIEKSEGKKPNGL